MDFVIENNIRDIFSESQCEVIGINEFAFDIYEKDENGKKTINVDKAKAEFEKIKKITKPEEQANKTKQLVHEICGFILLFGGGIISASIPLTIAPLLALIPVLAIVAGSVLLIKLSPATKLEYYITYAGELEGVISKLTSIYNNIKDKDSKTAKDLYKKIEEVVSVENKILAEIEKNTI